jgi:hypothetical protein
MDTGIALRTLMSGVKASEPSELHATPTPMKPDLERHSMMSFDQHVLEITLSELSRRVLRSMSLHCST